MRAEILRNWNVKSKGFDVEVELNRQVEREGLASWKFPLSIKKRLGEKKLKVRHGAEILRRIMLETNLLNMDSQ